MRYRKYIEEYPSGIRPYFSVRHAQDDADDVTLPNADRERLYLESIKNHQEVVKNPAAYGATPKVANVPTFEAWAATNPEITGDNNPWYEYLNTYFNLPQNKGDIWGRVAVPAAMTAMALASGGAFGNLSTYGSAGGTFGTAAGSAASSAVGSSAAPVTAAPVSSPAFTMSEAQALQNSLFPVTTSVAPAVDVAAPAFGSTMGSVGGAANLGFSVPGMVTNLANSAELIPGVGGTVVPAASSAVGSTVAKAAGSAAGSAATGAAKSAADSGGGMFDNFLKDLLKPSTLLGIGGQILGAVNAKDAAEDAAAAQLEAGRLATEEQRRQFDLTRSDMAPWMKTGSSAITELGSKTLSGGPLARKFTMEDFWADPVTKASFDFGLDEGRNAIERRAAASGMLDSGATLKALTRFGTDYTGTKANESYNRFTQDQTNLFNRLAAISGIGQTAANTVATTGANTANNVSNNIVGMGNARGASTIAGANAVTGAVNNIGNWLQNQEILNRMPIYRMGA